MESSLKRALPQDVRARRARRRRGSGSTVAPAFSLRRAGARRAKAPVGCGATTGSCPSRWKSFDIVVNLFTSFGFFSKGGDPQALAEFRRVLRSGAALVLETMHGDRLMAIFRDQDWEKLPD
jgi:hypothetical protein